MSVVIVVRKQLIYQYAKVAMLFVIAVPYAKGRRGVHTNATVRRRRNKEVHGLSYHMR